MLIHQPGALGLRHAARIAGVHPRSAQLALKELVGEGLVRQTPTRPGPLYEIDRTHPQTPVLAAVFAAAACASVRQRSVSLRHRARVILPFVEDACRMLSHARKATHDP